MALWDSVTRMMALAPWQHEPIKLSTGFDIATPFGSEDISTLADFFARLRSRKTPWRRATVREAMGVPAIFRSVTFIANTVGALSMEAWRSGQKLAPDDRPRLIVRPDPFQRPREFFRDTAYNLVTRGEFWWWAAKRDPFDDSVMTLLNVPPHEVTVEDNPADPRYPIIEWRGKRYPNRDMIQGTYLREPGELRGVGPLQMCGAAVSVSVESQEWAANFYADGGMPALLIKAAHTLGSLADITDPEDAEAAAINEAQAMLRQWVDRANNGARVIDPNIEDVKYLEPNPQGAQMLDARMYNVGEAVRMIGVPGSLLSYATPGSTLTYQNVSQELDKFTRTCLWPDYLEPIEQAISDQLPRATIARFNVDGLLRSDPLTRAQVYEKLVPMGVITVDEARTAEGYEPGDVERAPVPSSPPAAVPDSIPVRLSAVPDLRDIRCSTCNRLVGRASGPAELYCRHCKAVVAA